MRLRALVLAAGLVWPVSAFSETATRDAVSFVLAKDLFGFCSNRSANSQSFCCGYLAGAVDTLGVFNAMGATKIACVQQSTTNDVLKTP